LIQEWLNSQKIIIGYIFRTQNILAFTKALGRLNVNVFSDKYKIIWMAFVQYYRDTGGLVNLQRFREFLRAKNTSEKHLFELEEVLQDCVAISSNVDEGGFIWHVGRLLEIYRRIKFEEIRTEGYDKGRDFLFSEVSKIEGGFADFGRDGDISEEIDSFISELVLARNRNEKFVDTGFPSLDREILGLRPGDVCLVAGWTGVGKTTLLINVAVDVVFKQKKNVVYVTTETVREQVIRRIYSRLTRLSGFKPPISSKKLKSGDLTKEEAVTLKRLQKFLKEESHGSFMIVQAPLKATMSWLAGQLVQYETRFPVDLLILDDIRNMTPVPRRAQEFEEIAQLIRDFKRIARSHAGKGIPVISPYHVNREAYKSALNTEGRRYNLSGLASSAEAERQTDVVISLWKDEEDYSNTIRLDVLKMRDGRSGFGFNLRVEFDYQYMYEPSGTFMNVF